MSKSDKKVNTENNILNKRVGNTLHGKNLSYQLGTSHQRQNIIQSHSHSGKETKGH